MLTLNQSVRLIREYANGPLAEPVQATQAIHISAASYQTAHDSHDLSQLEIFQLHLCIYFSHFQYKVILILLGLNEWQ
jgi:hypothetical protein